MEHNPKTLNISVKDFDRSTLMTEEVVRLISDARGCLSRLDELYRQSKIPMALRSSSLVLEAVASSRKEGSSTTIAKMYDEERHESEEKDIMKFIKIMGEISTIDDDDLITFNSARKVCTRLEAKCAFKENEEVVIQDRLTKEVRYKPPVGRQYVLDFVTNWENFINSEDFVIDPLVSMAISHYMFEAIHPFLDGNGRTGRLLNVRYLVNRGLISSFILPLSVHCVRNQQKYDNLLLGVSKDEDWNSWVKFMLEGVIQSSNLAYETMKSLENISTDFYSELKDKRIEGTLDFVSFLFEKPITNTRELSRALGHTTRVARRMLDIAVEQNLLSKNGRTYFNDNMLKIVYELL